MATTYTVEEGALGLCRVIDVADEAMVRVGLKQAGCSSCSYSDHPYITTSLQPQVTSSSHKPESHQSHASQRLLRGPVLFSPLSGTDNSRCPTRISTSLIEWKCLTFYNVCQPPGTKFNLLVWLWGKHSSRILRLVVR